MADRPYPENASAFVEQFFSADAPRAVAFVAPPQTGGVSILLGIVARAIQPHGRALVVLPWIPPLQHQAAERLRQLIPQTTVQVLDSARFREDAASDTGAFAQPGVYIASLGLVADAALEAILANDWDVIALDAAGAEFVAPRVFALDEVIASPRVRRILLKLDFAARSYQLYGSGLERIPVAWKVEAPWTQHLRTKVVEFQRNAREVELLLAVEKVVDGGKADSPLVRAALSCPAALEASLTAWRNKMVHAVSPFGEESMEPNPGLTPIALQFVEKLFLQIDELDTDSKLDALLATLGPSSEIGHVVVFTVFVATAQYLHGALGTRGHITFRVSGDMSERDREDELAEFRTYGGVLVVTVEALRGVELGLVDRSVHYDLPASIAEYHARSSRLRGTDPMTLESILLVDASSVAKRLQPNVLTFAASSAPESDG